MTDLVIIHPGAVHGIYGDLGKTLVAVEPPLWARLCAGYLIQRGYDVRIIDQEAEQLLPEAVATRVAALEPRLVAIAVYGHQPSASTQQMAGARAIAQALRATCPGLPLVMLGNHPSALPERTLREEPVDYVIDGEGPVTLEGLLQLRDINDVHEAMAAGIMGLVARMPNTHGNGFYHNKCAPLLDLDADLSGDNAWHLLPMDRYVSHNWQRLDNLTARQPYASIHTTLGCPYTCRFCMINVFQHSNNYRRRSPERVIQEIAMLYGEYGVRTFKIVDELFVLTHSHYEAICRGLIDLGIGDELNIWVYARPDTVREGNLDLLRRAGIRWLAIGVESGDADVRDEAGRAMKKGTVIGDKIRAVRAAGINVIANYIFGLRGDDTTSVLRTFDLAQELNTEWANFYCAMAYPGSALYDDALREGWTLPETWAGYSQHNPHTRPLDTGKISGAEVLRFRDWAFNEYFSSPRYLDMIAAKFGPAARTHVEGMTRYKLPRRLLEGEIK